MEAKAKCTKKQVEPNRKHFRDRTHGQAEPRGRPRDAWALHTVLSSSCGFQCLAFIIYFGFSCHYLVAQNVKIIRKNE